MQEHDEPGIIYPVDEDQTTATEHRKAELATCPAPTCDGSRPTVVEPETGLCYDCLRLAILAKQLARENRKSPVDRLLTTLLEALTGEELLALLEGLDAVEALRAERLRGLWAIEAAREAIAKTTGGAK